MIRSGLCRLSLFLAVCIFMGGCTRDSRRDEISSFLDEKETVPATSREEAAPDELTPVEPGDSEPGGVPANLPVVVLENPNEKTLPVATRADGSRPFLLRSEVQEAVAGGPGRLLGFVRVRPHAMKRRFLGFEIVELLSTDPRFQPPHLRPGDVILKINGVRLKRPENLFDGLQALRHAPSLELDLWRNQKRVIVSYAIHEDGDTPDSSAP